MLVLYNCQQNNKSSVSLSFPGKVTSTEGPLGFIVTMWAIYSIIKSTIYNWHLSHIHHHYWLLWFTWGNQFFRGITIIHFLWLLSFSIWDQNKRLLFKSRICEQYNLQSYQITLEASNYLSNFAQLITITCVCTPRSRSHRMILIVSAIICNLQWWFRWRDNLKL